MLRRCALAAGALLAAIPLWLLAAQVWSGHAGAARRLLRWLVAAGAGRPAWCRSGAAASRWCSAARPWPSGCWRRCSTARPLANDLDGFATPSMPEAVVTLGAVGVALAALGAGACSRCAFRRTRRWHRAPRRRPSRPAVRARARRPRPCPGLPAASPAASANPSEPRPPFGSAELSRAARACVAAPSRRRLACCGVDRHAYASAHVCARP